MTIMKGCVSNKPVALKFYGAVYWAIGIAPYEFIKNPAVEACPDSITSMYCLLSGHASTAGFLINSYGVMPMAQYTAP